MIARLVNNRVADVELAAGEGGGFADLGVIILDVFDGNIADELVQDVASRISQYIISMSGVWRRRQPLPLKNGCIFTGPALSQPVLIEGAENKRPSEAIT